MNYKGLNMDKHNEESNCYEKLSEVTCRICDHRIPKSLLSVCRQEDGSFICTDCQHDADAEKHREEMGRD